jgi:hypothetical protein
MSDEQGATSWDDNTAPDWLTQVDNWPWVHEAASRSWRKSGQCPRCHHRMDRVLALGTGPFFAEPSLPDEVSIACNCDHDHEGRPAGESGCGQAGIFSPPKQEGKST